MDETASPYRLLHHGPEIDVITLEGFDGGVDEPVASWIKVDNLVRIAIVACSDRDAWGTAREAAFRDLVRHTAATYPGLPATGILSVQFSPPDADTDDENMTLEEPVIRLV